MVGSEKLNSRLQGRTTQNQARIPQTRLRQIDLFLTGGFK